MRPLIHCFIVLAGILATAAPAWAQGDRPSAMRLFPAETVLWVRTPDARLLIDRLRESAGGQMFNDPEVQGLVNSAWGVASDSYEEHARELLDADLEDLLKLPAGEIAFGFINRRDTDPAVLLIADFGDRVQVAAQVVERLEGLATEKGGAMVKTEQLRSDEATVIRDGNDQSKSVAIVQRENTFVVSNDPVLLQLALDRWDGIPVDEELISGITGNPVPQEPSEDSLVPDPPPTLYLKSLAENPSFAATFREISPGGEEPPQAMFYADPIGAVEAFGGRQTGVRIAMATFPSLGLDGIKGLGGAMWVATETWDSLARAHLLLSNPRSGAVKIARLDTGETSPPPFVPAAVENYLALRTEPTRVFDDVANLVDQFQYEGAFREQVEKNLTQNLGIDFEKEFIGNLDGSLFYITGYTEEPRRFGARTSLAVGVLDEEAAKETLDKLAAKQSQFYEKATIGELEFYQLIPPPLRRMPPSERPVVPCVAIVDGTLLFCEEERFFRQMLEARDGTRPSLGDSLQYRLVRSRLDRLTDGRPFSIMGYHDSEPLFRHLHERANSPEAREGLDQMAERVDFFGKVRDTLDGAEFPSLETLLKYTTPSGSVMIDTETGWHMISFSFKRASE